MRCSVADPFKPKPLVDVALTTEFGGIEDLESFKADGVAQRDYTYVEGFSEMRVARDEALGALARGEIRGKDVPILPVNLRWFRTVKGAGSDPDQMRVARARNLGYRALTEKDIGQPYLKALPPGGMIAPDGTIKTAAGDNVLMIAPQQAAARNAMQKKIATEAMVDGIEYSNDGMGAVKAGGFVERSKGPDITPGG